MFVPSLSWQTEHFSIKLGRFAFKRRVFAPGEERLRARKRLDRDRTCEKRNAPFVLSFPQACPEPVLANHWAVFISSGKCTLEHARVRARAHTHTHTHTKRGRFRTAVVLHLAHALGVALDRAERAVLIVRQAHRDEALQTVLGGDERQGLPVLLAAHLSREKRIRPSLSCGFPAFVPSLSWQIFGF